MSEWLDMTDQFEKITISAGRDYSAYSGYEYVVMAEVGADVWRTLARQGGFKSKAAAQRAGLKIAQSFAAPALF